MARVFPRGKVEEHRMLIISSE